MEKPTKSDELNAFIKLLIENGFRVFVLADGSGTWAHFSKDNKIGYVEFARHRGFKFTTVHKPNRQTGTGFGLQGSFEEIASPTITDAEQALIFAPHWAKKVDLDSVVKYRDVDEWQSKQSILKYTEVTV